MIDSRLAGWILSCAVPPGDREAAIGDLAEEYAIRSNKGGPARAAWWYWNQVFRSIPWFIWTLIRRDGRFGTFRVVIAAVAIQAGIEVVGAATMARFLRPDWSGTVCIGLAVVLSSLFIVSYAAARVKRGAGAVLGLLVIVSGLTRWVAHGPGEVSLVHAAATIAAASAAWVGTAVSLNTRV